MRHRYLLDTQIIYAILQDTTNNLPPEISDLLRDEEVLIFVSVTSLWEIVIKWRIGKLGLNSDIALLPNAIRSFGFEVLAITEKQALAPVEPEIAHRDPFDRLLLSICFAEDMELVTTDRILQTHKRAWKY
jgi:PIN domain nuclease of toxin-antitoxin system